MKKYAFTLAEALIALTIVGVIAAVTLPAVSSNVQKNQVGPALAKALGTMENANSLALQKWGARTLDEIPKANGLSVANYFDLALSKTLKAEKLGSTKPAYVTYKTFNMSSNYASANNGTGFYQGIDDIAYIRSKDGNSTLTSLNPTQMAALPPSYSGKYYTLYIDTNGFRKKPNAIGKDLFLVWVDSRGAVIPYGSEQHREYTNATEALWKTKCKATVTDAEACAGSVADNKFKVIYKY